MRIKEKKKLCEKVKFNQDDLGRGSIGDLRLSSQKMNFKTGSRGESEARKYL